MTLSVRSYASVTASHRHEDLHQFILPLTGSLEMEVDGREGRVDRARAVVVPVSALHAFAGKGNNRFLIADLPANESALAGWVRDIGGGPVWLDIDDHWRSLAGFIADRLDTPAAAALQALLETRLSLRLTGRALPPGIIHRAIAHLGRNLHRPVRVSELTALTGLGRTQLHALFRRHTGRTIQDWHRNLRLHTAHRLLLDGKDSIAEVAAATGFADQAALTRHLRRWSGSTPGQVRRLR